MTRIKVECTAPNCNKIFNSMAEYEKHYNEEHLVYYGYNCYPKIRMYNK